MHTLSEPVDKKIHKDGTAYILRMMVRGVENDRVILLYSTEWDMCTSINGKIKDLENATWEYGELLVKELENGSLIDMKKTPSFLSDEISKEDVLDDMIKCTILNSEDIEILYCEEGTGKFIESFQKDCIEIGGNLYPRILPNSIVFPELYELKLVMEEYRYYASLDGDTESGILMVRNKGNRILSDNYFAFDSMINDLDMKKESDFLFITEEIKDYIHRNKQK